MEPQAKIPRHLFDRKDHELIQIVNDVLRSTKFARKLYFPYFHPNGIKEMAETKGLRSAYAVAQLLSSLEIGGVEERLNALRSLRLEVIDSAERPMPKNTARVLLQIMKSLVRAYGDPRRQHRGCGRAAEMGRHHLQDGVGHRGRIHRRPGGPPPQHPGPAARLQREVRAAVRHLRPA
jgi:hypothetical protein